MMKGVLKVQVFSDNEDMLLILDGFSGAISSIKKPHLSSPEQLETVADESDTIFVDIKTEDQVQLLSQWASENREFPVYVITSEIEADGIRRLMRAGAKDVFNRPFNTEEIRNEMEQLMASVKSNEPRGKIITLLNAKGGNGSTTLAVNSAVEMARDKQMDVLLVDLDIQFGDAALALDVHSNSTVIEALSQSDRLDQSLLSSMVTKTEDGLDVLASPAKLAALDSVRPDDIHKLFEVAMLCYDVIIVDLPRVITPWTNEAIRWSDHIFLVVQGCVASVRDSHLLQKHFVNLSISMDTVHYIHNRAGAKHTAVDSEQLRKSLHSDRLITVHNDYDVAMKASDMGKSVRAVGKSSKLYKGIRSLVDVINALCGHKKEKSESKLNWFFGKGNS